MKGFRDFVRASHVAADGGTMVCDTPRQWAGWWAGFHYRASCVRRGVKP